MLGAVYLFVTSRLLCPAGMVTWSRGTPRSTRFLQNVCLLCNALHKRRTFATILLRRGISPKVVADIHGNSNINTLLNIYAHVLPEDKLEAMMAIQQALQG